MKTVWTCGARPACAIEDLPAGGKKLGAAGNFGVDRHPKVAAPGASGLMRLPAMKRPAGPNGTVAQWREAGPNTSGLQLKEQVFWPA